MGGGPPPFHGGLMRGCPPLADARGPPWLMRGDPPLADARGGPPFKKILYKICGEHMLSNVRYNVFFPNYLLEKAAIVFFILIQHQSSPFYIIFPIQCSVTKKITTPWIIGPKSKRGEIFFGPSANQ